MRGAPSVEPELSRFYTSVHPQILRKSPIRKGGLKATILQDPLEQGKKAVETMVAHLRGQSLDPEIITPLRLITQANVDQFQPAY